MAQSFVRMASGFCGTAALWLLCLYAQADNRLPADRHPDEHPHITENNSLDLATVFTAALARAPESRMSPAYAGLAENQRSVSRQLLPGQPKFIVNYWDDRLLDNTGIRELEAGVEVELWHLGQKKNAGQLADALESGSIAWQQQLALDVAGQLRKSLHRLLATTATSEHARQAVNEAERLRDISQRRHDAGEISRADLLQSDALVYEAQQTLLNQQAEQVDAERDYFILTGLVERPAAVNETPPVHTETSLQHPTLAYLNNERLTRERRVQQVRQQAAASTTVALGARRQRDQHQAPDMYALALSVSIPFGRSPRGSSAAAAARVELAQAEVDLHNAQRQLSRQLHEVEHQLEVNARSLELARATSSLRKQQWQLAEKAFALGETDIRSTILALQHYRHSELQWQLLNLNQYALISALKQTLGELP